MLMSSHPARLLLSISLRLISTLAAGDQSPHTSAIQAMFVQIEADKQYVVTGDKDGKVNVWIVFKGDGASMATGKFPQPDMKKIKPKAPATQGTWTLQTVADSFPLDLAKIKPQPPTDKALRSVCIQKGHLLVGTASAEIYEVKISKKVDEELDWKCVSRGHFSGELWGLATHPLLRSFATGTTGLMMHLNCKATLSLLIDRWGWTMAGGDDASIRIWDVETREQVSCSYRKDRIRALAYSPNGKRLALGFYGGAIEVLEIGSDGRLVFKDSGSACNVVATMKGPERWIEEIKYSFEGSFLAVGSHDRSIYIYDAAEKPDGPASYRLIKKCARHSSYITHIDFGVMTREGEAGSVIINEKGQVYDPIKYVHHDNRRALWLCLPAAPPTRSPLTPRVSCPLPGGRW